MQRRGYCAPSRPLKHYLSRMDQCSPDCSRPFIYTGQRKKSVTRNTIFFWLRAAINEAFRTASDSYCTVVKGKVMSCVLWDISVQEKLCSPTKHKGWNMGFINHDHFILPKDCHLKPHNTFSIGPVVMAQQVM